eukprot:TRINITY_DN15145_c0_g1_i1.p1 TRINITY_DN15145_c0_g1~~TRINITY_DN15145_c0_g1_i1.p1  ORF type:complete len:471 (+),score=168.62 TRINITY_DN15145_c0_g1_i1:327-1739(+)
MLYEALEVMKEECAGKVKDSLKFYNGMRKEVLEPLNESHKQLETRLKDMVKSVRNNRRKFADRSIALEEAYSVYNKCVSTLDETVSNYDLLAKSKDLIPEEKTKYNTAINQALKACKDSEVQYKERIYAGRDARIDYINALGLALDMFNKEEDQRIDSLKKTMEGMLKWEQELKAVKEDNFEAKKKVVTSIEQNDEIVDVVKNIGSLEEGIENITFKKPKTNFEALMKKFDEFYTRNETAAAFNYESALKSIQTGVEEGVDEQTQEATKTLNRMINLCWDGKGLSTAETDRFNDLMKEKANRKLFCDCMNQYRRSGIFSMSYSASKHVAALLKNLVNAIEAAGDTSAAMSVIILSETYYYEQKGTDGNDRIYLQQIIAKHKYFRSEEFWRQMIEEPYDRGQAQLEEESEEEKKTREVNEVFSRLGTYAHNMLQFEIDKKTVEDVIFGYADKKNLPKPFRNAIQVGVRSKQ